MATDAFYCCFLAEKCSVPSVLGEYARWLQNKRISRRCSVRTGYACFSSRSPTGIRCRCGTGSVLFFQNSAFRGMIEFEGCRLTRTRTESGDFLVFRSLSGLLFEIIGMAGVPAAGFRPRCVSLFGCKSGRQLRRRETPAVCGKSGTGGSRRPRENNPSGERLRAALPATPVTDFP